MEYDGSHFCGWQSQPSGCGVQDILEQALSQIACHPIRVITAGRTDTGVHAFAQVVHFETDVARADTAWVRGVNALLPKSVSIQWMQYVPDEFHARFSAMDRCYRYILLNQPVRPAILQGKVGWYHAPLDIVKMQEAANLLIGEHNFSAFRAAECQAKSPVKNLRKLEIIQQGNYFIFDLCANAFLHHMVRNIVGSLIYVGNGKQAPSWMKVLLESTDRTKAAPTFAPDGLYLAKIAYDPKFQLPEFANPHLLLA